MRISRSWVVRVIKLKDTVEVGKHRRKKGKEKVYDDVAGQKTLVVGFKMRLQPQARLVGTGVVGGA